jgi:hypothetical protein
MMATRRSIILLLGLAITATLALSCGSDDTTTIRDCFSCQCNPAYCAQKLTQKERVLTNLELAYNNRRVDWYTDVLDANFTFLLSPGDVGGGLPEQWDRATEVDIHTRLFDKNYTALPCQSIFLDVRTEDGLTWTEFNPPAAPAETWSTTTLNYDFKFEIYPNTYIPLPGSKASFTIRNAGTESAPHWQLVEMHDLGGATALQLTSGTKPSTLGSVLSLYR